MIRYSFLIFSLLASSAFGQLLFTPFQGFGSSVQVGTTVVHVTTNAVSGPGSLAACVSQSNVRCVFDSSMTITNPNIFVTGNQVAIDGFSAPSPGVTITGGVTNGGPLNINNVHDVVVQGIKFRNCNTTANVKCILIGDLPVQYPTGCTNAGCTGWPGVPTRTYNIVLDHNEFIEAQDEVIDLATVRDMTVSWNLVSNAGGDSGCQLTAFGSYHVTTHHNLFVNCKNGSGDTRTPLAASGWSCCFATQNFDPGQTADVEWNVTIGWVTFGFIADTDGEMRSWGNFVGNYQADNDGSHLRNAMQFPSESGTLWYLSGNANASDPSGPPSGYFAGPVDENFGPAPEPFCTTNSNKIDCTKQTIFNPGANCTSSGFAANSCQSSSLLGTYTTPVSGPCVFDNARRITEWTNVVNNAGVVAKYADDTTSSTLRSLGSSNLPTNSTLSQAWNSQTGTCNVLPAPATHLFAVLR